MSIDKDAVIEMVRNNPDITLSEVGKRFGCTREYVRQLAGSVDRKLTMYSLRVAARREQMLVAAPRHGTGMRVAWDAAAAQGLTVERAPVKGEVFQYSRNKLAINGVMCQISASSITVIRRRRKYARFGHVTAGLVRICVFSPRGSKARIFILPRTKSMRQIFVPLTPGEIYKNIVPKIDWLKYEDAWWVLKSGGKDLTQAKRSAA